MDLNITWNDVPWKSYNRQTSGNNRTDTGGDSDGDTGPADPEQTTPGWIISHDGSALEVVTRNGAVSAEISGRLRHLVELGTAELPAVGDFVRVRGISPALIDRVLPRKMVFRRKEAGIRTEAQVICANADLAIIVTTAPSVGAEGQPEPGEAPAPAGHDLDDFSLRRIERYVATLDSRIRPIVVLNKCDLTNDPQAVRAYVAAELPGAIVVALSALTGDGVDALAQLIEPGQTAVMVGSSGSGKSTLITQLTGQEIRTGAIRGADGRGRHTTTSRRIYRLPAGGLLVDTPGMREVQLWADDDAGADSIAAAFREIAELEPACRFSDCRHEHEPGCAVKQALSDGTILPERYRSFLQLREETEVTTAMRRERSRERGKQIAKFSRELKKTRNR
jgi:ribosome biogenesis GTPase / thiamine phosphate phosphatase